MLDKAKRYVKLIADIMFVIATVSLVLLLVLNSVEIIMRYGFKNSNVWSQEVSLLFICITIFFGFARVVTDNEDISITFVKNMFKKRHQLIIQLIVQLLLAITSGYMFYFTILLMNVQQGQKTLIADIPYILYSIPLATVLFIICIHSTLQLINSLKDSLRNDYTG